MKNYQVKFTGTAPLLIGKFIVTKTGTRKPQDIPVDEMLHKNEQGQIGLPNRNILFCIRDGASRVIERQRTTYKKTILGLIGINEDFIVLSPQKYDVYTRPLRRGNGERILVNNPMFKNWSLGFTVTVDDDLSLETFMEILEKAGKMYGLGVFRTGGFGRFTYEIGEI